MKLTLEIKRRSQNEWAVLGVMFITLSMGAFLDLLKLPGVVKYSADFLWLFLLITIIANRFRSRNYELKRLLNHALVFWAITVMGFVLNWSNPLYYLWGFRNNFRFFVYFFACAMFLKEDTGEDVLKLFDKMFYLNFLVVMYQFFVLGKKMDFLGGIFGVQSGCNGRLIQYLCIMTTKNMLDYLHNDKKIGKFLLECALSLIIAALSELKFFFALFAFIVASASLLTGFSYKKLIIILAAVIGLPLAAALLMMVFPNWEGIFNLESMFNTVSNTRGYTGYGDMNRLTTIPITWERFLHSWPQRFFGLGMGNCDTSAFQIVNTLFFQRYSYLHYNWFSSAFMFMETGILGFGTYMLFFVNVFFATMKRARNGEVKQKWCQMAMIIAMVSTMLVMYNSSMRIEGAYMIYFVLALPFIQRRSW